MAVSGIWGASFLFIAVGLEALTPGVVTFLRVGLGAAALHLLPGPSIRVEPEDRLRLLGVSILWVAIPFTLFPIAEQHINSAVTGMLNGSTPVRSEEHTSELQSLMRTSYAVFFLKKKR